MTEAASPAPSKPMAPPSEYIVFLDLETTGLDERADGLRDEILEIGVVITDSLLRILQRWSSPISVDESVLALMDDYVKEMHTKSGLLDEIRSGHGKPLADAASFVEELVKSFVPKKEDGSFGKITMAGNSVHFDLGFLKRQTPSLAKLFSHRLLDVSVLREVAGRWAPHLRYDVGTEAVHRALDDALSSHRQLDHYLSTMVVSTPIQTIEFRRRSFWERCCAEQLRHEPHVGRDNAEAKACAELADAKLAEWDKRFLNVKIS